jgi:hypothetical protein
MASDPYAQKKENLNAPVQVRKVMRTTPHMDMSPTSLGEGTVAISIPPKLHPCTFPDCRALFEDEKKLVAHKANAPEHDYCKRCNEDFENDDMLMLHKLKSSKHIVCPMCADEFKSTGGRDIHIRNVSIIPSFYPASALRTDGMKMHKTEQRLVCVGCAGIFTRAGALMGHIERGECRNIRSKDFAEQRIKKDIMKAAMLQEYEAREDLDVQSEPDQDTGGVSLAASITKGLNEAVFDKAIIKPSHLSTKRDREAAVVSSYLMDPDQHFPELETTAKASTKASVKRAVDLLADDVEGIDFSKVPAWGGASGVKLFNDAKPSTIHEWVADVNNKIDTLEDPEVMSSKQSTKESYEDRMQWNPYEYLNALTGQFTCPHKICGRMFKSAKEFEGHLLSPAHTGGTIRCPSCLRIFKSHSALVSHCENATQRCKISKSANFRQIIDQISGGILEIGEGRFADGTVKYLAADKTFW